MTDARTLWEIPVPSTGLLNGPVFRTAPGRVCEIEVAWEGEDDIVRRTLRFTGVEAYKCTYLTSCDVEVIESAYDKLIEVVKSEWAATVQPIIDRVSSVPRQVTHYRIFFDDGPAYDLLAESMDVIS